MPEGPAGRAVQIEVVGDHVDQVGVVEAAGDGHRPRLAAGDGIDVQSDGIRRVADDPVAGELGADPHVIGRKRAQELVRRGVEVALLETVRRGRDRRIGVLGQAVVRDRGPGVDDVDRVDHAQFGIHQDLAAAVLDLSVIDIVQEDALPFGRQPSVGRIDVVAEFQPAPVAALRRGLQRVRVHAQRLVLIRREDHALIRDPQHLQSAVAAVDRRRGAAHADPGSAQLEQGAGVDHQRHVAGDVQLHAVAQHLIQRPAGADLVGQVVAGRVQQVIQAAIADDSNQVAGGRGGQGRRDVVEGVCQGADAVGHRGRSHVALVDKQRVGLRARTGALRIGRLEPEIVHAPG